MADEHTPYYRALYATISMYRLGVGKTVKNVINTWKGSVLWFSVMNSVGYSLELCSFSNLAITSPTSQLILQPFRRFTYVTAHSSTLPLLHLRHSSFSNLSFPSPTSKALHSIHLASRPWWTGKVLRTIRLHYTLNSLLRSIKSELRSLLVESLTLLGPMLPAFTSPVGV